MADARWGEDDAWVMTSKETSVTSEASHVADEPRVLVFGSGMSGTSAALAVAKSGVPVTVFEKEQVTGGSAALSAGMYWSAASYEALRSHVPDGDPAVQEKLIEHFRPALDDIKELGVRVASEEEKHQTPLAQGYPIDIVGFLEAARSKILASGGRFETGTRLDKLTVQDDGTVVATVVTDDGSRAEHRSPAVILATGGFQGNDELLLRYVGAPSSKLILRSNPGSSGDGLMAAESIGAASTAGLGTFYGHLVPYPLREFQPRDFLPLAQYYSIWTILLNAQGKRFADELRADETLNQDLTFQQGDYGVLIFDSRVRAIAAASEPFPGFGIIDRFALAADAGANHATAGSLDELLDHVAAWGFDRATLEQTVAQYIEATDNGSTSAEGIPVNPEARAPKEPPFYALQVRPSITFTLGGISIDTGGHVLDSSGAPIPGVFAAGADTGGISNYGYVGGLAPAFVTGRWAGVSAASRVLESAQNRSAS